MVRPSTAALFLLALASLGAAPPAYKTMPPGRYALEIRGMLCTVCARAIAAEWSKLPEVQKATVDYDREVATVTVRIDKTLDASDLRRALRRAEKVANMGAKFEMRDITYQP